MAYPHDATACPGDIWKRFLGLPLEPRIVFLAAEGQSNAHLARQLGVTRPTALLWRTRYAQAGLAGLLRDARRPGRRKQIRAQEVAAIVNAHRHTEFLAFLERVDRATLRRREIHLILDNYGTHKHPRVQVWVAAHLRYHLHFAPTGSS